MVVKHYDYNMKILSEIWLRTCYIVALSAFLLVLISWKTLEFQAPVLKSPPIEIQIRDIPITLFNEPGTIEKTGRTYPLTPPFDFPLELLTVNTQETTGKFQPYDQAPKILKRVAPQYPEIARRAGVEGRVILSIGIDKKGNIIYDAITVLKNTTGNSGCVEAAIEAVKRFKFSPAYQREKPVNVKIAIPFKFRLNKYDRVSFPD